MPEGKYLAKIVIAIIANNQLGITDVLDLKSIRTTFFDSEEYPHISRLIEKGNISDIKELVSNKNKGTEYLDILTFKDQRGVEYIVSIYDNEDFWHDPKVIEISLNPSSTGDYVE